MFSQILLRSFMLSHILRIICFQAVRFYILPFVRSCLQFVFNAHPGFHISCLRIKRVVIESSTEVITPIEIFDENENVYYVSHCHSLVEIKDNVLVDFEI